MFRRGAKKVMSVTKKMIQCSFGMLEGASATFDEHRQIVRHEGRCQQHRLPFALTFLQEFRAGE